MRSYTELQGAHGRPHHPAVQRGAPPRLLFPLYRVGGYSSLLGGCEWRPWHEGRVGEDLLIYHRDDVRRVRAPGREGAFRYGRRPGGQRQPRDREGCGGVRPVLDKHREALERHRGGGLWGRSGRRRGAGGGVQDAPRRLPGGGGVDRPDPSREPVVHARLWGPDPDGLAQPRAARACNTGAVLSWTAFLQTP